MVNDLVIQDAHLIILNICMVLNFSSVAIYTALSFPLGIAFGSGRYNNAKKISITAFTIAFVIALIVSSAL